jgi:hypothetical protein
MDTCEVTFDETKPCNSSVFEFAVDDEVGKKIFVDEEDDAGEDDGDDGEAPATHVPSTSTTMTTVQDGPSPTPPTILQDQVEATVEVVSKREAPRRVQVDHPPSRIISDINEHTTRSRSRNASHFAHLAFVATFEPKDIGHALSDSNWVNDMHEELENFERNQVWEIVEPPPNCKPIGT